MRVIGRATAEVLRSPQVAADIDRGALCVTGNPPELCEPIECHDDLEVAHRRLGEVARRGHEFKLVMSTDAL